MGKQTKNIITRAEIEKKLYADNRASLKHTAFVFFVLALVGGVWFTFVIPSLFEAPDFGFGALFFLVAIVGTVPAWVMLPGFVKDLIERKYLENGDTEIVMLPLLYETEETRYTRKTRMEYTQHKFHFEGFGAFLASPEQSQKFTRGDEFYIVYYKGAKKIRLLYPCALDGYRE